MGIMLYGINGAGFIAEMVLLSNHCEAWLARPRNISIRTAFRGMEAGGVFSEVDTQFPTRQLSPALRS